jgi:hypothetical protein
MNDVVQKLQQMQQILWRAEGCLRQGSVIYANRHMGYLIPLLASDEEKLKACARIKARLRKGEQLDAHDEMKSLLDKISNEIRKLETAETAGSGTDTPNP